LRHSIFPTAPRPNSFAAPRANPPEIRSLMRCPPREIPTFSLPHASSRGASLNLTPINPNTQCQAPPLSRECVPLSPTCDSPTSQGSPTTFSSSGPRDSISPLPPYLSPNSEGLPTSSSSNGPRHSLTPSHRPHPMVTRAQAHIHKPKIFTDGTVRYPRPRALTASLDFIDTEPSCFSTAVKSAVWREAMATEFNALLKNGTWTLVPSQPSMNIVGCKWVFRIKQRSDGSVERYKARLVAKGFHQQSGIDYAETYSPVIKPVTIRTVLSLAMSFGWSIKQIDVSNAFLHGFLNETVYMAQPHGFEHPQHPKSVCLLRKAIYGLKQAPRAWFSRLSNRLLELGFVASKSDSSLFLFTSAQIQLLALVYVDDILLTGSSPVALDSLIRSLSIDFPIKDLGPLSYFLGVEVTRCPEGLHLSQHRYIMDLLQKTNMMLAKPITSPMSASAPLSKFAGISLSDATLYRSTVGVLQYLAITRPDISFAVNKCSQFMQDPRDVHWTAVKRILRYLKHSITYGLLIRPCHHFQLAAFSDADWAGCPDDRKSTSGYCTFLGPNLLSWNSKKQPTVSRSITEAEYKALANASVELIWLQSLLKELGVFLATAPTLFCDNIGATYLSSNPAFHARTKHIEIDYHFVRDRIALQTLSVKFVSSKDQLADILTKPVVSTRFASLRTNLNVCPNPSKLRGPIGFQSTVSAIQPHISKHSQHSLETHESLKSLPSKPVAKPT